MRTLTIVAMLCVAACRPTSQRVAQLTCDIIRTDGTPDVHRLEIGRGRSLDSTLLAAGRGGLIVRVRNHRDSSAIDRTSAAVLTRVADGNVRSSSVDGRLNILVNPPAGTYSVMVSCVGCSRAVTSVDVVPGRTDTIDAYLTRFPTNCEEDRQEHP